MKLRACSEQEHNKNSTTINELPNDILTAILSRLSPKEASRTCVLSRRWRYLTFFKSGNLEFDIRNMFSSDDEFLPLSLRTEFLRKKFIAYVNRVLELHLSLIINGLIIRISRLHPRRCGDTTGYIDTWINFALHKEVKMFELDLSTCGRIYKPYYSFPDVDMLLLSRPHDDVLKFGFVSLRSLRLTGVAIKDEVVHYFLASCPYLEHLCIRGSDFTTNLRVVGRLRNLKDLEISDCKYIQSLVISAPNLVSCTYQGDEIKLSFKKVRSLSELTLGGDFARSFIYKPNRHSSYSVQLVKLVLNIPDELHGVERDGPDFVTIVEDYPDLPKLDSLKHLELNVRSPVGRSIHFFTSFVKAAPLLNEFRIKISYMMAHPHDTRVGFPELLQNAVPYQCCNNNLKAVTLSGYVGCPRDDEFVERLREIAPSLETLAIETESEYYEKKPWVCANFYCWRDDCISKSQISGAKTRIRAKKLAGKLKLKISPLVELIVT